MPKLKRLPARIQVILIVVLATAGYFVLVAGLSGSVCLAAAGPAAQDRPPDTPAPDSPARDSADEAFVYEREGRGDPFVPFVTEKVLQADTQKEEELTGLQRFETGQLTLVAIVIGAGDQFAMVQDSVGKGYVIRQGTKIGRAGAVDEITANRVIVKIPSRSMAGEIRYNTVEMLLKKEGEK